MHSQSSSSIRWSSTFFLTALLANPAFASLPMVDFSRMGQVGLAGAFAGLSLFNNSTAVTFDPSASSLLARTGEGALTTLGTTNAGGSIQSGCAINNIFYLAGSFSSIGNTSVSASNIASYTPSSGVFAALGSNGPNGPIYSLYCDVSTSQLWVGGSFTSPGSSVAIWDTKSNSWSAPPFKGFTGGGGKVLSITSNASENSLLFAGSFLTAFAANAIALNNTNNPNVPYSPGATPFSSSLVPVPLQGAEILGQPSSSDPDFSDISNILCPAGPDGPGNTWLAANGNDAVITIRDFSSINAYGVRLGNTFQSGFGTTTFSVTSIPDNTVQTLSYVNPSTGQNITCTATCPLSTDSSILYQDFIFTAPVTLTGIQITLSGWTGEAPGLHMLQLLSSGAFASSNGNLQSCFSPNPSNTTSTGQWTTKDAVTNIPATLQTVLVSTVAVGTSPSQAPSFTWQPYVSASGQYDVYLVIPGCADFQDCPLRTSVQVTVFPGGGSQPWVSIVSQQVQSDTTTLIYSGPIVPSSTDFVTTVSMTLANNPAGTGQDGQYELVAGNVALVLTSADVTSAAGSGSSGSNATSSFQHGFGFFEWPLSSDETSLDMISIDLYNALGATTSTTVSVTAVAQHPSGIVYLGGNFQLISGSTSGVSNIVASKSGSLISLPNNGLNGPVTSFVLSGNELYVGGSFTDTNTASMQGKLNGVAIYDISSNSWKAMGAGVNGVVNSLALANGQIVVVGNFTEALNSSASGVPAGGLATWNVSTGLWVNSGGFVVGNMTFIGNGTLPASGQKQTQFVAGNVDTMAEYGSSGLVILSSGGSTGPLVTPMGIQLTSNVTNVSSPATLTKRHPHVRRGPSAWISHLNIGTLFTRQSATSSALPPSPPAPAPAVLAGAFWTNVSTSHQVAIIGGNFSFSSSSTTSSAVAIYDPVTSSISALAGAQINGVVRTVYIDQQQQLFVGGEFNLTGTSATGLALYDLSTQQWDTSSMQPLQSSAGSSVIVRSITSSIYKSDTVIVAGSFAQAGSVSCQAICLFDTTLNQWNPLGSGIQGDISSVSYAGGGLTTNVAQYNFADSTWAAIGNSAEIPGPVTAVTVNNGNYSSIFAAGRTADGSSPFMMFWDGVSWNSVGSSLQGTTNISQLLMVPLLDTHSANSIIESDRMLMISGALSDSSFGSASSVLFDGSSFIPYMATVTAQGALGSISSLFYSLANFSFGQQQFLATGIVILISIAIAAGVVFLLALIGILWTLLSRRDDRVAKYNASDDDDDDNSAQHRPSSLLEHINAATRTTILGAASPLNPQENPTAAEPDPFGPDGSNYLRAETPSDAVVGTMAAEEEFARPAHARYSFDGTGEGELPLTAGLEVEVLDDRDTAWWYTRNPQTGQEGVVPAAYLY
ncbi:cortical protein marker for cell polarity-domain-containing protein [Suillus fuscotomentosus]|uniref:Cortical protein marker for cell polarity-domain-containing protein n=1 Tax=Suillus fuscotomentosus TaxID=1912939 RepID=A0AAD4E1F5_9AGAM|nr:cortical protein marker for cell polarity-domain-containing protein [Suillus fuscotomentosus]KAG1896704.1 cortical protein marker for cell polarity-domain-containing protein [Suillus fuscotomentosus]